jgi:alkylated DNA repair dioxygenase AlkB
VGFIELHHLASIDVNDGTLSQLVPGLRYVPAYLESDTHDSLVVEVDSQPWHAVGDQRRIQFYGYWYEHTKGGLYRVGDLPSWASEIASRLKHDHLMPYVADQLIVTEYLAGQGIRPHVDAPVFADVIVGITLGSACIMELTHQGQKIEQVLLEPRSALVLSGHARGRWQHSIPAREVDVWIDRTLRRSRRVSLTFRKVLGLSGDDGGAGRIREHV